MSFLHGWVKNRMFREMQIIGIILLALVLVITVAGGVAKADARIQDVSVYTPEPNISLDPSSGLAGTSILISGTGFFDASSGDIELFFDGVSIGFPDPENGTFTHYYTVPNRQEPGEYMVEAVETTGDVEFPNIRRASTTFEVKGEPETEPSLEIDPVTGRIGMEITITGHDYTPDLPSPVTVSFGGTVIATTVPDENGMFTFQYTVPTDQEPGEYTIEAVETIGDAEFSRTRRASATFEVEDEPQREPSLALSPRHGPPGSEVSVSGSDFPYEPGAQILILFDDVNVGSISVRDDGTFYDLAIVPAELATGPCEVRADEVLGDEVIATASAEFIVDEASPATGSMQVSTSPTDARIIVDGEEAGNSPVMLDNVEPGTHTITAVQSGYREEVRQIQVTPGERMDVFIELIELGETTGTLEVHASCEDARVYIDGQYMGTCPLFVDDMNAGAHHVMVRREGYFDYDADVSVESDGNTYLYASMFPLWPVFGAIAVLGIGGGAFAASRVFRMVKKHPNRPKSHCTRPGIEVEGGLSTGRDTQASGTEVHIDVEGGIEREEDQYGRE